MNQTEKDNMNQGTDATRLALLEALAQLQYHTEVNDDGTIRTWYNGRFVEVIFKNNFIRIWDLYWKTFCPGDAELPYFKEAVNSANRGPLADIIYSYSEDMELIYLHSKVDFWFVPEIPYPDQYLNAHLRTLDTIKDSFNSNLKDIYRLRNK